MQRASLINEFLKQCYSERFTMIPLPADASLRRYYRIISDKNSAILMDSPPEYYRLEDFIFMAEFLTENDFSAPLIYQADLEKGFLLLEDFGDLNLGQYLLKNDLPSHNKETYKLIIDLLVKLQSIRPIERLKSYTKQILIDELELYTDWYIPFSTNKKLSLEQKAEFLYLWDNVLDEKYLLEQTIILRDYHVENMMFLNRENIKSIGLLDFQDALIGHPLYDVVSVLQDARFEVDKNFAYECLDYYLSQKSMDKYEGYFMYHLLGAQRNSRIAGVFARKAMRDNQDGYLKYMPRVLRYLEDNLSSQHLQPIAKWIKQIYD